MSSTSRRYSPEVRERAVRLVFEHEHEHESQWAAIVSVAAMIGCTPETLRTWVRRAEVDDGRRPGVTSDERVRLKELERENRELRRANEILKSASVLSTRQRNAASSVSAGVLKPSVSRGRVLSLRAISSNWDWV
jgi:transposase